MAEPGPILLATRSRDKVREIGAILGPRAQARLITLDEAGIAASPDEDDIECHDTFVANALAKATYFARRAGLPTVADDSGLCVDALDGEPGVRSKRFAGRTDLAGHDLDLANNRTLLERLAALPGSQRRARYVCAAVFVKDGVSPVVAIGTVVGTIIDDARGEGGFGYDPHFLVDGCGQTFGELDASQKHALSHRGRAFRALAPMLR